MASEAAKATWTPGHEAALDFQKDKAYQRKVEGLQLNELLPSEITDEFLTEAAIRQKDQQCRDASRKNQFEKNARSGLQARLQTASFSKLVLPS